MIRWADVKMWSIDWDLDHEARIGVSGFGPADRVYFSRVFNPERLSR